MVAEKLNKKKNAFAFGFILGLALLIRVIYLSIKPPHFDEGINGWFVDQMAINGFYRYDPVNYHGPLHFYVLQVFKFILGRDILALRIPTALFGAGAVYLLLLMRPYIGRFTAYTAALLMAFSPAMVFYSRYSIHEVELLFFTILAVLGFLRLQTQNDRWALWQISIGLAGMIVTKESFILHIGTFLIALGSLKIYEKFSPSLDKPVQSQANYRRWEVGLAFLVFILLIVTFYSGFFRNWAGVGNLFKSFLPWFKTSTMGNGHDKPFWYWTTLILRYEWAAFFGLLLLPRLLFRAPYFLRLVGVYGFGCFLAYGIINYKTPWCIMQIIWPFFIVAGGVLAEWAHRGKRWVQIAGFAMVALSLFSLAKSIDINFYRYTDESEPYVYIQTFPEIMGIIEKIQTVTQYKPQESTLKINLFLGSDWPLPWLLADYRHVLYNGIKLPKNVDGDLVLVDGSQRLTFERKIKKEYFVQRFRLRSAMGESFAYFNTEIFKDFFGAHDLKVKPKWLGPIPAGPGLLATYYSTIDWKGPVATTESFETINFNWSNEQRPLPPPFGIIFSGELLIPKTEEIEFILSSDDGSDLWIDNQEVISNLGPHAFLTMKKNLKIKKGWHKIQLRYNDYGGQMIGQLHWKRPGQAEQIIPMENLRHVGTDGL